MDRNNSYIEIVTGSYGEGTAEQNSIVDKILGGEAAKSRFELYFHWYNILHELGHSIMFYYAKNRPHMVDEEQLVNDFAVSYWLHYGEAEKLAAIEEIIEYALAHIKRPAAASIGYLDYARIHWNDQDFFNFNNYGWFQFSCVESSLLRKRLLKDVLVEMGVQNITEQPYRCLSYSISNADMPRKILKDAVLNLRDWGVLLPEAVITFDQDPNMHMSKIVER